MGVQEGLERQERLRSSERAPLIWLVGFTAVAFVAALILGRVDRSLDLAEGSPEAVVATYLEAVVDGDDDAARRLLAPAEISDVQLRPCLELAEFDVPPYREVVDGDDISVTLRSVSISGEVADVRVTIEVGTGPAIFDSGWDSDTSFGLRLFEVAGADEWRLDRVPWPFEVCR